MSCKMFCLLSGDCKAGVKFPLLRALNTELVRRSEGEDPEEDGETCDPKDYEVRPTRRPVVTRKPWSPSPSTSPDISNDLSQDNLPSQPSQPSNSGEHERDEKRRAEQN